MDILLSIILFIICIAIAYWISRSIYIYYYDKPDKTNTEINWIYGVWIFLAIVAVVLNFALKIPKYWYSIVVGVSLVISLIVWRICLAYEKFLIAQIFIVLTIIILGINIIYQRNSNIYYVSSLYLLAIWIITVAFLTFKMKSTKLK